MYVRAQQRLRNKGNEKKRESNTDSKKQKEKGRERVMNKRSFRNTALTDAQGIRAHTVANTTGARVLPWLIHTDGIRRTHGKPMFTFIDI